MWEIYDALIQGIAEEPVVIGYCGGHIWTEVESSLGVGVAMSIGEMSRPPLHKGYFYGQPLKTMAQAVKSWNFAEASLGLAAINSWYNNPQQENIQKIIKGKNALERDAFLTYQEEIVGKKVAVIGHFPFLEKRFKPLCSLSILERAPQDGDYPDSACEYLLPEQDYVFITGVTLVNKTLPRLLALSEKAKVVLVGPSVPLANCLFDFGVTALESFVVENGDGCVKAIHQGINEPIFAYGSMVSFSKASIKNL